MTTIEEWRIIERTSNYEISNYGEVRNKITNKILKLGLLGGYLSITLIINGKKILFKIHRLVAEYFLVCPDEIHVVNHKDGNKINNRLENLEWVSRSENSKHAFRLGLNKGKKIKISQYTLDNVFIKEYDSPSCVETETGIFGTHIIGVCRGKRKTAGGYIWKYVDECALTQPVPDGKIMSEFPNYIITNDGKVYNSRRKLYLTLKKHVTGYTGVSLSNENENKSFNVHRLVALLFLDNPNNYPEVNHIDFDKTNNKVENLEWISCSDNIKHNFSKYKA
jgi:hypothetical protein